MKQFTVCIEEALFKLSVHRDRALTYKMEEVQITTVDEIYVEQSEHGSILKQIARVRLFFLGFLSGKFRWHDDRTGQLYWDSKNISEIVVFSIYKKKLL